MGLSSLQPLSAAVRAEIGAPRRSDAAPSRCCILVAGLPIPPPPPPPPLPLLTLRSLREVLRLGQTAPDFPALPLPHLIRFLDASPPPPSRPLNTLPAQQQNRVKVLRAAPAPFSNGTFAATSVGFGGKIGRRRTAAAALGWTSGSR